MANKVFLLISVWVISTVSLSFSQDVLVLDQFSNLPLSGVRVFALDFPDTLETNQYGIVNLDIFPNDAIMFFYFPYFKTYRIPKRQILEGSDTIYLQRGSFLQQQNRSKLTLKEYSADLPFYTEIINLDEDVVIDIDDQMASDKIMVKNNNGGVTIFRGLEANKTLLVLDGMRLNNAIYRNGKIETALSFDRVITERIQKIYAPSFLFYNSDAIGGVIHYFTKIPQISNDYPIKYKFSLASKFESANKSRVINATAIISTYKFSSFTSLNYGYYDDIVMGKNRKNVPASDSLYGLNLFYVDRINGRDTMLPNPNPYKQLGTNYQQIYFLQKFRYKFNENLNLLFNIHYTSTSDVGIFSGLTEINGDHLRFAECKFMPQDKIITQFNIFYDKVNRFFNFISINLYSIYFNEYRLTRKYQNPVALHQIEKLYKYAINIDAVKLFNIDRLVYGVDYYYNKINSSAYFENIITDSTWFGLTRYPTNGSFSHNWGFYLNYKKMSSSQFYLNTTFRYDFVYTMAKFSNQPPQLPLSFTQVSFFEHYPTASISLDWFPFYWLQIKALSSISRHHPIIDDFGKVMVKDFVVTIPTNNLKDEKDYSCEFGANISFNDNFKIYGSAFYTYIKDAIILKDTTLNDLDSLYFGIDRYEIATKVNAPKAYIWGYSLGLNVNFPINDYLTVKFNSTYNYIKGWNISDSFPLPHIPPVFGNNTLIINYKKLSVKISNIYNGKKSIDELSPVGEDYIEKASEIGFLPWSIYNFKVSYKYKNVTLETGVYNIFDLFYKMYGTAIASPGRSFMFMIKIDF